MSDFFKFEYIDPKNIILNKDDNNYGTFIEGTKSGIKISTIQQPTDITFKNEIIGGDQNIIIAIRNDFNTNKLLYGESPQVYSINTYDPFTNEFNEGDQIIIYDTGTQYGISNSRGPYLRLGKHNIISEKSESKVGIGTLFPAEKVHISGGNLRVEGNVFANNLYTKDNPSGFITSQNVVFITGNQTISGLKFFVIRPQVNGTGILLSGEAYPSNNPSGFITGIDTSSFYPRSNPSGFITGVDLTPYATLTNLNLTGSNLQNQINNLNNTYATDAELSGVNNTLNTKINSLSGSAVLLYGNQTIDGIKTFRNSVYVHDLYVTGTEFIANVENNFIESPYILLNLTGGATDGGIFFVTGTGLTGINDYGPIIGFDHSDKFKFGIARRSDDLSTLDSIAGISDITNYSGFVNTNFYLKSNPSGFITGVDLSSYATINNLFLTGSNLQTQINNINSSGFITGVDLSNYATNLNLQNTGQNLNQKIDNLSGYSTGTFATINNLNLTGSGLQQNINIVSGNLTVTGQNLQSQIDDLSVKSIAYAIALG